MENNIVEIRYSPVPVVYSANSPVSYHLPNGMDETVTLKMVNEILALVQSNALTVRQSQVIFDICKDYVLDHLFC